MKIGYSDDLKKNKKCELNTNNILSYLFENKKNKKIHGFSIVKKKKKSKKQNAKNDLISRDSIEIRSVLDVFQLL